MQRDIDIFELIEDERERQELGIELIASENFVSDQVMEAAGSVLTNKYFFTDVCVILKKKHIFAQK